MKTSQIVILVLGIAVAAIFTSIDFAVTANFYNIQFFLLIGIQCLGIYALLNLKGEAQRRENKSNNINEVSQ
jgi:predicted membrane channel-forming protein YqfA (hemolysin III family)